MSEVLLYADLIDHLRYNYRGGDQDVELRDSRQAIQNAYREVAQAYNWRFYNTQARVNVVAAYGTGTVAVTASTGVVTLSGGVFPSWAALGLIRINNISYPISSRDSNTQITLNSSFLPASDIAAGSTYSLYRATYPLPTDLLGMNRPYGQPGSLMMGYISPDYWLLGERVAGLTVGVAQRWTIIANPDGAGGFAIEVQPYPSADATIDFIYKRSPRPLRLTGFEANSQVGTIAISSTAVTGTTTAFSGSMVGSWLRVGDSTSTVPTSLGGPTPYTEQRRITAVTDTTHLTIASAFTGTYSGARYLVSDPVDIWTGMVTAVLRRAEAELAVARQKDVERSDRSAQRAILEARERDQIVFERRTSGNNTEENWPLVNYSVTP